MQRKEEFLNYGMGWKPQLPDIRDVPLSLSTMQDLPPSYDMRSIIDFPVYDQGQEGSCTANGGAFITEFNLRQANYPWKFTPSRQFLYYNTRQIEGTVDSDSGATIRDTIKSLSQYGVCPEDGNPDWSWPYVVDDKQFKKKPSEAAYKDALLHVALTYEAVPQESSPIRSLLVQHVPVIFGFTVHNSFMTQKVKDTGVMPKPHFMDGIAGGHCVVVVGYLDDFAAGDQGITSWAICRNSWGSDWGQDGYFLMPWSEVLLNPKQATDFWAIHTVGFSGPHAPAKKAK